MNIQPKKEDFPTIAEMRHEVIDNTIKLELMLEDIIQTTMGFEPDLREIGGEDGESEVIADNEKDVMRFKKFFLEKLNLEKKFDIIKNIIKEDLKKSVPTNIWGDAKKLREIRNTFAHTLAPKYPYKPKTIGMVASDLDCVIKDIEEWKKLYEEHTQLFKRVYEVITKLFYIRLDLSGIIKKQDINQNSI